MRIRRERPPMPTEAQIWAKIAALAAGLAEVNAAIAKMELRSLGGLVDQHFSAKG